MEMTVEMLWSLSLLVLQFSAQAAHSHKGSQGIQGLSCLNDFVNNVSCTWNKGPHHAAPGVDCKIVGVKTYWVLKDMERLPQLTTQSCKLSHHQSSLPGCSLVFDKEEFNQFEVMPNISLQCGNSTMETLTNYRPYDHIKMNPPGRPSVNITANDIWITWSPGSPLSVYITEFDFNVQVKLKNQTWENAYNFPTRDQEIKLESSQLKGAHKVRVRVKHPDQQSSHWSNWSPTASWMEAPSVVESTPEHPDWFWVKMGVLFSAVLLSLLFYGGCVITSRFRRHKGKPVPNPSKYFHTLHSVHKGNLKRWLNPQVASDSFFTAEVPDHISPVEVCEIWDVVPSTSPSSSSSSSTSALLHFQSYPSAGSDTSGIVDNFSSSSSSCFYNMGYFMSASSNMSAQTAPTPAYFTYKEDFHSPSLHISLCPSFTAPPTYEALKREPQSPDSGFGIDNEDDGEVDVNMEEVFNDPQGSSAFNPTMHLTSQICPPPSAPPLPHPHSQSQKSSDRQPVDSPVPAAGGGYAAWPVAGAVCRSSSMPVEPCKTGYLTLKELQTTFSNKSI